jgi:hypothetical protein
MENVRVAAFSLFSLENDRDLEQSIRILVKSMLIAAGVLGRDGADLNKFKLLEVFKLEKVRDSVVVSVSVSDEWLDES